MHTLLVAALCLSNVAAPNQETVRFWLHGRQIDGKKLSWSDHHAQVMGRDGRLWTFSPRSATNVRHSSFAFQSYSPSVLSGLLQQELGNSFRVVTTRHYVVALHRDVHTDWGSRFEALHDSFELYFSIRGFHLQKLDFPLVAIVWPTRESFMRAARTDIGDPSHILGYYSNGTNRITLYDMGSDLVAKDPDARHRTQSSGNPVLDSQYNRLADVRARMWEHAGQDETSALVIHEATHQIAYNAGIHKRFNPPPKWLSEGLATMFEAPGVWNPRAYTRREDRINRSRFKAFREDVAPRQSPSLIWSIVASDALFKSDPHTAYAEAWALSFFLMETQPRKYWEYLALTANRPGNRLNDFTSIFGSNFSLLNTQLVQFMEKLP